MNLNFFNNESREINSKIKSSYSNVDFVYVVFNPKYDNYHTRIRNTFEEYSKDLELIKKFRDILVKEFIVPKKNSWEVYGLCDNFVRKENINVQTLNVLEKKINELIQEEENKIMSLKK